MVYIFSVFPHKIFLNGNYFLEITSRFPDHFSKSCYPGIAAIAYYFINFVCMYRSIVKIFLMFMSPSFPVLFACRASSNTPYSELYSVPVPEPMNEHLLAHLLWNIIFLFLFFHSIWYCSEQKMWMTFLCASQRIFCSRMWSKYSGIFQRRWKGSAICCT